MQLEFHQLDRRWEHPRVRQPHLQRRLMAWLAESGQPTPILVVLSQDNRDRYVVIDGHKRIAALQQLGRRFDRSVSWVSRRLALVGLPPETIQQQVREGTLGAQLAMRYLAPVARVNIEDCARMAAAFVPHRASRRLAEALPEMVGPQQEQARRQIESARRELDRMAARIGKEQEAKHAEPGTTNRDSGVARTGSAQTRDRTSAENLPPNRAQSAAIELHQRAGNPTGGEGRTLPPTDPRSFERPPGESGARP